MLTIEILGTGCANCRKLEEVTREALATVGVEARITKVTEQAKILSYDILTTPALVINGKVVCSGRLPGKADLNRWITTA